MALNENNTLVENDIYQQIYIINLYSIGHTIGAFY